MFSIELPCSLTVPLLDRRNSNQEHAPPQSFSLVLYKLNLLRSSGDADKGQGATLKLPMEGLLSPRIHCGLESGSAFAVELGKIDPNQACVAQGFCQPGRR